MLYTTRVFLSKGQLPNEMMTRQKRHREVQMTERGGEREVVTIETFGKSERAWGKVVESSKNIVLYCTNALQITSTITNRNIIQSTLPEERLPHITSQQIQVIKLPG